MPIVNNNDDDDGDGDVMSLISRQRQLDCKFVCVKKKHQRSASIALYEGNPLMTGGLPAQTYY